MHPSRETAKQITTAVLSGFHLTSCPLNGFVENYTIHAKSSLFYVLWLTLLRFKDRNHYPLI